MRCALLPAALAACLSTTVATVTVLSHASVYVIDTHSRDGFVTTVSRLNCDILSLRYGGKELQYGKLASQIGEGLGPATVSVIRRDDKVVVQCVAENGAYDLVHYMVFRDNEDRIYMATHTNTEPVIGELQYVFRLAGLKATVPTYPEGDVSNTAGGTYVERRDVVLVNGQTRSKFYSSERFIDNAFYCATDSGKTIHACWLRPDARATEKSSGGPFFRDVNLNWNGGYQSVIYYLNSNHAQTERYRQGFHGPYVFALSRSSVPEARDVDIGFFEKLGLKGYVGAADRGSVRGTATGVSKELPIVVHWFNDEYQAWAYASKDGAFTSPALVKGKYTMVLYQHEFTAATTSVVVEAGKAKRVDIGADNVALTARRTTIFQLGEYDGRPTGFLNADKQLRMHPSDQRMAPWSAGRPVDVLKKDAAAAWPMALFRDVNDGQTLTFALDAAVNGPATLRIATTISFASGRPQATVNNFACPEPREPLAILSRSVTRGASRGRGELYECTIPSGTLVRGANIIRINITSESGRHSAFLSPAVVFDAIELFH